MKDTYSKERAYPIGKFQHPGQIEKAHLEAWTAQIASLPSRLRKAIEERSPQELDKTYRPGSWTIYQLIHHLPDSHMNGYIRMKWALTEPLPTIKPYNQEAWALLGDVQPSSVALSLDLLEALHKRWVLLINSLTEDQLALRYYHPANEAEVTMAEQVGQYAWHGEHHLAHIHLALSDPGL